MQELQIRVVELELVDEIQVFNKPMEGVVLSFSATVHKF
jgi:hypothetical protein